MSTEGLQDPNEQATHTMNSTDDYLMAAREALDSGNARQAYALVTGAMLNDPGRSDLCMAASESLRWLGRSHLAALYERAATHPADYLTVLELAQEVLAIGDAPLAIDFARRAVDLNPRSLPSIGLLALALAADFRPAEGRDLLIDYRELEFSHGFVRAWCALLCGEIDSVLRFVEDARMDSQIFQIEPEVRGHRDYWVGYIEQCLARRVTVDEPSCDLRSWHFIQYGAAILTTNPAVGSMAGRFTANWPSYREVAAIVKALHDLLVRTERRPTLVVAAPGRDSAIIGRIAAEYLRVPIVGATDAHAEEANTLIVAARADNLVDLPIASTSRRQTVFAFEFNWLIPGFTVPDICGMLSLSCTLPWHAETRFAVSASKLGTGNEPAESEVVKRILDAEGDTNQSAVAAMPFYLERAGDLKGHRSRQRREQFRRDSPVPTNRSWRGFL